MPNNIRINIREDCISVSGSPYGDKEHWIFFFFFEKLTKHDWA